MAWDTAVAINRHDPSVVVVSYNLLNYALLNPDGLHAAFPQAIVLHEHGKRIVSDTIIDTSIFRTGDCRGVLADPKGNFWYNCTNLDANLNTDPVTYISRDKGKTWTPVASVVIDPNANYDFPTIAYGPDGQGNEGLWVCSNYQNFAIPVYTMLLQFINVDTLAVSSLLLNADQGMQGLAQINVQADGTVIIFALIGAVWQSCLGITIKKPGPLTLDLVQNAVTVYDSAFMQYLATPLYPLPNSWPNTNVQGEGYPLQNRHMASSSHPNLVIPVSNAYTL